MEVHDFMSPAKDGVKKAKHIMEKRRRARINASLAELKSLLPGEKGRKGSCGIKMEKADILERAVEHLRLLQETYQCGDTPKTDPNHHLAREGILTECYNKGYIECLDDVDDYLMRMRIEDVGMRAQVMRHIASRKARFKQPRAIRADFFLRDKKVKRCGNGLGQRECWSRDIYPKSRLVSPLSHYQHTHSPADSTTPEGNGSDGEMGEDTNEKSSAAVKSEYEWSSFDELKENAALDCSGVRCNADKRIPESSARHRRQMMSSEIKLEVLDVGDDDGESSCYDGVSTKVVGCVSDNTRGRDTEQPRSSNNSSISSNEESLNNNRDSSSCGIRRYCNSANSNYSFFLNASKTPRFIVITNRGNHANSKIEDSNEANSCNKRGDISRTSVSSPREDNLSEDSLAGCSVTGNVEHFHDSLKPSSLLRSLRTSTQLRVDPELSGNTFRAPAASLDGSQPRKAHSSSIPLSQRLSILIPANMLPNSGTQALCPHPSLTDPPQAAVSAVAGNDVNAQPDHTAPKHFNLLLKASSDVSETASHPHNTTHSLPSTTLAGPSSPKAEPSNRLLVAQLIKPLNDFTFPVANSCNLTLGSRETEHQPCDLSLKGRPEEEQGQHGRGSLCHRSWDNCPQAETDCTVWRPW